MSLSVCLLVFLLVDWFFVGLLLARGSFLFFFEARGAGRPEGYLFHLAYRMGIPLGKLLPPRFEEVKQLTEESRFVAKERKFWEILAESQHDKLVLSWLSVVLDGSRHRSERVSCWDGSAAEACRGCSRRRGGGGLQCGRDAGIGHDPVRP